MNLKAIPDPVWYLAGLTIAGFLAFRVLKGGASAVGNAVNPVNRDNVFHSGTNAIGAALTGDDSFSLGASVRDAVESVASFFTGEPTPGEKITQPTATATGATRTRYDNPANANTESRSAIYDRPATRAVER